MEAQGVTSPRFEEGSSRTSSTLTESSDDIERGQEDAGSCDDEKFTELVATMARRADLPTGAELNKQWHCFGFSPPDLETTYQAYSTPERAIGVFLCNATILSCSLYAGVKALFGVSLIPWADYEVAVFWLSTFVSAASACTMLPLRNRVFENREMFHRVSTFTTVHMAFASAFMTFTMLRYASGVVDHSSITGISGAQLTSNIEVMTASAMMRGYHAGA